MDQSYRTFAKAYGLRPEDVVEETIAAGIARRCSAMGSNMAGSSNRGYVGWNFAF